MLTGKMVPASDAVHYIPAQLLGGLAAGVTYTSLVGKAVPLAPGAGYSWSDAAFAEIVYTFVLCFVVLNVATLSGQHLTNGGKAKQMYGFAIGFCIVVGGYAIGAMKGGTWMNCVPYTCFEVIGAAAAAGAFFVCRDEEFTKGAMLPLNKKKETYGAI